MTENAIKIENEESQNQLPTSPEQLMKKFDELGISYELYHHEAVYTVAESQAVDAKIPGTHCRNLFLRDKKKKNFLLVLPVDVDVDMKKLPDILSSGRLSFGSNDRLWEYLGVRSGSVCPFAVINDTDNQVKIFLEKNMIEQDVVNYHPLLNTMTVSLKPADLIKFIEDCGHEAHIVDLSNATPEKAEG